MEATAGTDFDMAILGGGSAGYAAARTAAELGLRTAVVDHAEELGGLCILRGCMPSKTLIESADRALTIRRAAEFGLAAQSGPAATRFIRDRKRQLIETFARDRRGQLEDGRFALLRGRGRFVQSSGPSPRLSVALRDGSSRDLIARTVLVATGSVIFKPEWPGLEECGFWTSDTLLDAAELPGSFIVLGGGAIALEMAHFLEGMGRKVTVVQRSGHLLTGLDTDVAEVVSQSFARRGMAIHCGTQVERVEGSPGGGKRVWFRQAGERRSVEAEEILLALGRVPALEGLGLEQAGVRCGEGGQIEVGLTQQTSNPAVFAAGDVCGPLDVVHLAVQQGEVAARNAAALVGGGAAEHRMDYRAKLFGVFTHPQVAVVGLTLAEAVARGVAHLSAAHPFDDHGKSMVMGETEGFVRLLADPATGALLGGAVVGPEATELIHEVAVAMHLGATVAQLAAAPHYHPTLSEIWTYPAEELAKKTSGPL